MFKLGLSAKLEVQKLLTETKHQLSLSDFDDIAKLDKLCEAITSNDEAHNDVCDLPVFIGGVALFRPTIGALEWYKDIYFPMFDSDALMADGGLAYLCSLDNQEELRGLYERKVCKKVVKQFLRKLKCTRVELSDVLEKVIGQQEEDEKPNSEKNIVGKMTAMLCREYGGPPNRWLWKEHVGIVRTFVNDYAWRVEEQTNEYRRSCGSGKKPPPTDSYLEKIEAAREQAKMMRTKWLTEM